MPEQLQIDVHELDTATLVVRVDGEIDMLTTPALSVTLTKVCTRAERRVLVDLAGVEFLGSSGLSVLADTVELCRRCGLGFAVCNPRRAVLRAIQISGLDTVIPIHHHVHHELRHDVQQEVGRGTGSRGPRCHDAIPLHWLR